VLHSIQIQHYFTSSFDFLSNSTSEYFPPSHAGTRPGSLGTATYFAVLHLAFQAVTRVRGRGALAIGAGTVTLAD